jgi:hypothetical protein
MSEELYEGNDTRKSMVSASSQYSTSYTPAEAFDGIGQGQGDSGNCWISSAANGPNIDGSCYIGWDFGEPLEITQVQMCRRDNAGTENFPKNFKVLSSNTGVFAGEEEDYGIYQNNDATFGEWSNWYTMSGSVGKYQYLRIEIHSKWNSGSSAAWVAIKEARFYISVFAGYFSGYVFEQGSPIQRTLYLHDRSDGALVDTTTSSGNGYYYLETTYSGAHYIVCLDDPAGEDYNDLILGDVIPTTVSG